MNTLDTATGEIGTANSERWQSWPTQKDSLAHTGEKVAVRRKGSDMIVLTGWVVPYTDLLGSGGILQPDPEHGMNRVVAAIRFPQDPDAYRQEMADYEFSQVA